MKEVTMFRGRTHSGCGTEWFTGHRTSFQRRQPSRPSHHTNEDGFQRLSSILELFHSNIKHERIWSIPIGRAFLSLLFITEWFNYISCLYCGSGVYHKTSIEAGLKFNYIFYLYYRSNVYPKTLFEPASKVSFLNYFKLSRFCFFFY